MIGHSLDVYSPGEFLQYCVFGVEISPSSSILLVFLSNACKSCK